MAGSSLDALTDTRGVIYQVRTFPELNGLRRPYFRQNQYNLRQKNPIRALESITAGNNREMNK
ncbi:hypothetical protein SAMN02744102_03527 [Paenibacillus barengoltzii]|nr:hypothetical protein SAMN02744102_03527 [Paenibacillus barengoltzii]